MTCCQGKVVWGPPPESSPPSTGRVVYRRGSVAHCVDGTCGRSDGASWFRDGDCFKCWKRARGVVAGEYVDASRMVAKFDEKSLAIGRKGKRFNSSILAWGDRYIMAYRDGWKGSEIGVAELSRDLVPTGRSWDLRLRHAAASYGREDPRLFVLGGRLHIMFVGVAGRNHIVTTNVLFARLSDQFHVEDVFHPEIPGRQAWEKNHSYFDVDGVAHAVYMSSPRHRIIRVEGNRAVFVHDEPFSLKWRGGVVRGGAPPVRVGDEYWSWFHGRARFRGADAYNVGVYTFSASPPYRPLRITPDPILWADHATKPADQYVSCVFPCGAVLDGGRWLVSMGVHDRWTEIRAWDHAYVESLLRPA